MVPSVLTDICRNLLMTDPCFHDFPTVRESSLALLLAMGSQLALKVLDIRRKRQCQMRQEYKLEISFLAQFREGPIALRLHVHASSFYCLELC